ncbi:MAG: hypothetical protein GC158_13680 [Cyanobacteria bacterium RI_101]|nr:hypothetical protein [Cyanobacteria bacterium RI_101]
MPEPKPKLSFRVDPDTYNTLKTLADMEHKTISDFTREVIEIGIGKKTTAEQQMLEEFRFTCAQMGEFTARAVKAAAGSRYFARLSAMYAMDITQYVTSGEPMTEKTKSQLMAQYEAKAKEFEEHLIKDPWETL